MTDDRFLLAVCNMQRLREIWSGLCWIACGLALFLILTSQEIHGF